MYSLLIFKILHCLCFCLYYNEIYTGTNFVTFGIKHITLCVLTEISLEYRIHTYLIYIPQEFYCFVNTRHKCFTIEIP